MGRDAKITNFGPNGGFPSQYSDGRFSCWSPHPELAYEVPGAEA